MAALRVAVRCRAGFCASRVGLSRSPRGALCAAWRKMKYKAFLTRRTAVLSQGFEGTPFGKGGRAEQNPTKMRAPSPSYYKQFANRLAGARLAEHEKLRCATLSVLAFANCGRVSPRAPLPLSQSPSCPHFSLMRTQSWFVLGVCDRYKAFNADRAYGHLEDRRLGLFNAAFSFLRVH